MPQSKQERDAAARAFVEVALEDAASIQEEYEAILERRRANREQLRSLALAGHVKGDDLAMVNDLYPERKRTAREAA